MLGITFRRVSRVQPPLTPRPLSACPTRDLPPASVRQAHVQEAQRAGVLDAAAAARMRAGIRANVDEYDIYPHPHPDHRGEWEIWTHDGPRSVLWWQCLASQATDAGGRAPWRR